MTRGGEVPTQVAASNLDPQQICERRASLLLKSLESPVHDFDTRMMENPQALTSNGAECGQRGVSHFGLAKIFH